MPLAGQAHLTPYADFRMKRESSPSHARGTTYLRDEQDKESIDILRRRGRVVHPSVFTVAESHTDRLIQEQHICNIVPRVGITRDVVALVHHPAAAELKQETGGGGTAGAAVEPENERVLEGLVARLLKPEEKVLGLRDVEIARELTDRGVADRGLNHPETVVGEGRVFYREVCFISSYSSLEGSRRREHFLDRDSQCLQIWSLQ